MKVSESSKIDWRSVILMIKRKKKWKQKTIAWHIGVDANTIVWWKKGRYEPRYSQGVELLRLAGME